MSKGTKNTTPPAAPPETVDKSTEEVKPEKYVVAVDSLCAGGVLVRKPKGKLLSSAAVDALKKAMVGQVDKKGEPIMGKAVEGKEPEQLKTTMLETLIKDESLMTPGAFEAKLKAEAEAAEAKAAKEATEG